MLRTLAALAGCMLLTTAAAAQTPSLPHPGVSVVRESDWPLLFELRPVIRHAAVATSDGETAGRIQAFIITKAGVAQAFRALGEHERDPEWYGACMKEAEIVARTENAGVQSVVVRERHRFLGMNMRYTVVFVHDSAAAQLRFNLDSTAANDMFAEYYGAWRLIAVNDTMTLVNYELVARSRTWLPQFVQNYLTRKRMPDFLLATRKRVEAATAQPVPTVFPPEY